MSKFNRRSFLSASAGLAAIAAPAGFASAGNPDAEIINLSDQIVELNDRADVYYDEHCAAFEQWCQEMRYRARLADEAGRELIVREIERRGQETGAEIAVDEHDKLIDAADPLIKKLWLIPAKTIEGKQAKVRALFRHVLCKDWLASDHDAEWDIEMTRKLLFEFAGMDGGELIETDAEGSEQPQKSTADLDVDGVLEMCEANDGGNFPANVRVDIAIAAHRKAWRDFLARSNERGEKLATAVLCSIIHARMPVAQDYRDQIDYLSALPLSAWEGRSRTSSYDAETIRRDTLAMIVMSTLTLRQAEVRGREFGVPVHG
jgi:hypothetical protein